MNLNGKAVVINEDCVNMTSVFFVHIKTKSISFEMVRTLSLNTGFSKPQKPHFLIICQSHCLVNHPQKSLNFAYVPLILVQYQ